MSDATRAILASYGRPPLFRRAYLSLRLRQAGYGALLPLLPERGLVVDLGAGDGLFAQVLTRARPGVRVLAVDRDPERVRRTAKAAAGLPIEAREGRMEDFPIPAAEAVVLLDVLHYLDTGEQDAVLTRSARALSPGGVLLLRDPDPEAGWRFRVNVVHERIFLAAGFTRGRWGSFGSGPAWAARLGALGLHPVVLPLSALSPFADRVVLGRKR